MISANSVYELIFKGGRVSLISGRDLIQFSVSYFSVEVTLGCQYSVAGPGKFSMHLGYKEQS